MYDLKNYKIKAEPVILGIESSCDETACAVIKGRKILSDIIVSSASQQALYGGVVPEIASRAHTDAVDEAAAQALKEAGISPDEVDAVAVTYGAGGAFLCQGVCPRKKHTADRRKPHTRSYGGGLSRQERFKASVYNFAGKRRAYGCVAHKERARSRGARFHLRRCGGRGVR